MQATPGLRRHGGRPLAEPLRGTVELSAFFTFLAGYRSSLRACVFGLSRHILAALAVFHDPALLHSRSLSISLARRQKKLLVERNRPS